MWENVKLNNSEKLENKNKSLVGSRNTVNYTLAFRKENFLQPDRPLISESAKPYRGQLTQSDVPYRDVP